MASEKRSHDDYSVGWICALPKEQTAATAMLDERHPDLIKPINDTNTYTLGSIGSHNVVIACLPKGQYGTNSAANVAALMIRSFPSIKIGLMVGIGGGVPPKVRLGDVVVSTPSGQYPGVVQWDLGKATEGGAFERIGSLNNPPVSLLSALTKLETQYDMIGSKIPSFLEELKEKYPKLAKKYLRRDSLQDMLYRADYAHISGPFMDAEGLTGGIVEEFQEEAIDEILEEDGDHCQFCDQTNIVKRRRRSMRVHHGIIASGNKVIKDGLYRDKLNGILGGDVLCFELEAAGLMNNFPCLVIRGICDYCDSHKNKAWQEHAATVAAAFAKELLQCVQPNDVEGEKLIKDVMRDVIWKVNENIDQVYGVVLETKEHFDTLRDDKEKEKQIEILNWLSSSNFCIQQGDLYSKCAPDTGQEFILSEEVQNWISATKQTMLCQGVPGAGKTFQMAILVNYLMEKFRSDGTVCVAYIYYNIKKQQDQKADHLLANLVKQLAQSSKPFPNAVYQMHDRHDSIKSHPPLKELSNILASLIQSFSRVFVLIDALDEANDSERTIFMREMLSIQEKTGLNLFATSRAIGNIAAEFHGSISRAIVPTRHDIFQFLDLRLSELSELKENNSLQNEIKEAIEPAIGGMFLLAELYINSLAGKPSPDSIRETLTNIRQASLSEDNSEVLDKAYNKSMERIQQLRGDLPRNALITISWIVKAKRQLKLTELQDALAVEVGASKLDAKKKPTIEHITQACASLLIIEGDIVDLVHYTAHEYFERPKNKWMEQAHENIMKICMTYLSFSAFREESCFKQEDLNKRLEKYPLYRYSAEFWAYHTNEALNQGSSTSWVVNFLQSGQNRDSWYRDIMYGHSQDSFRTGFVPSRLTALHTAAFFGIQKVVVRLIKKGQDPNAKDSLLRMPIWWAAWSGHATTVKPLLKNTTDPESRDVEYGSTSLLIAARRGHEDVVKKLLNKSSAESKDSAGRTPLSVAIQLGNKPVIDLLVRKNANIEARDNDNRTPLAIAAMNGRVDAATLLVEKGADIEAKDIRNQTPLMLATIAKYEDLVKYFMKKGAAADAVDNDYQTPLSMAIQEKVDGIVDLLIGDLINTTIANDYTPLTLAISKGNDNIAKWLIEKGANLGTIDGHKMTPLLTAIERGTKDIVKFLVEKGADLEGRGYEMGCTPLIFASKNNHHDIVEFLIQRGADLEAQARFLDDTALLVAARAEYTDVMRVLIEKGANIEARDNYGDTPLNEGARLGLPKTIQLLITNKADLEGKNNCGLTPLSQAAQCGKQEAVQLLLANNANIEARDNGGLTPLHHAAVCGKQETIQLLLDKNANIESRDYSGYTPLSHAAKHGQLAALKLLLDSNANIESGDYCSYTPLAHAAFYGQLSAIKLLLDSKANIETTDGSGRTPLSRAVIHGQQEVIKLLLDNNANIETKNKNGFTPLCLAADYWRSKVVELLLDHNASTEAKDNKGRTPLIIAVASNIWSVSTKGQYSKKRGLDECVRLLLNRNANIEVKDNSGFTPLAWAIHKGLNSTIKLLLDSKAGTTYRDASGSTLMHIAVRIGNLDPIRALLGLETFGIDEKDNSGRTPLSRAAGLGKKDIVKALLRSGKVNVNAKDNQGRPPLLYAVICKHQPVVKELLNSEKVDANAYSGKGRTPLFFAIGSGDESVVKALLDSAITDVNAKDEKGRTPLRYIVEHKNEPLVKMLLDCKRVDVNAQDDKGRTPLLYAITHRDLSIMGLIISSGRADINKKDNEGYTTFLYALKYEDESFLQLLFREAKIDVNAKDSSGRTPLSRAVELSNIPIVKALLCYENVDVEAKDKRGRTPLSYALTCDAARVLLNTHKVDVNSKDKWGRIPLWYAGRAGKYQLVELLVRRGAYDGSKPRNMRRWVENGVRIVVTYSGCLTLWNAIRASPIVSWFPAVMFHFSSWSPLS